MTPLDSVLDAIYRQTGKRPTGRGPYSARCPAHHDRKPSLAISQGETRVVLCCHAGCSEEEVLRALGMGLNDLKPQVVRDISLDTVKKVVKEITVEKRESETESKPTKLPDVYESFLVWVDGLPDDYSDPSRDEYVDGWKCGFYQALSEWDSVVSLAKNRAKRHPEMDLAPVLFEVCRLAAAAYRTRHGAWDAGAGTKLLTYARSFPDTIPAIDAEVRNQLNDGGKDWLVGSALKEAGMPPPEVEPENVVVDVPQAIPAPDLPCLMCGKDITHRSLGARFCGDVCSKRFRRQDGEAMDVYECFIGIVRRLDRFLPIVGANDDVRQNALNEAAHMIKGLTTENDRLGERLRTAKNDWGPLHDQEVERLEYRNHLKYQHLAKSTYEENMQRPTAPEGDQDEG